MKARATSFVFSLSVALMFSSAAFSQDQEATEKVSTAPVAYVYAQVTKGVNVYSVATSGKPTLVKGSPFSTSGQMEAVDGKYLISVGNTNLHTYSLESNGAVGKQAASVNTQNYTGSECGTTSFGPGHPLGSLLDHTGKHFYVQLSGALDPVYEQGICDSWQSYTLQSDGNLVYNNDVEYPTGVDCCTQTTVPTVSSNDDFAYSVIIEFGGDSKFYPLTLASDGLIALDASFTQTGPIAQPCSDCSTPWYYFPVIAKADSSGHLAALMYPENDLPWGNVGPYQLASFTINRQTGGLVSTNTWENMPIPQITTVENVTDASMSLSPSGKILALSGYPGLQLFHFNGAAPITNYGSLLLPAVNVDQLAWDNDNHLYVLSYSAERLYVYTVTPTSISEVSGSPFVVQNAYGIKGLIVVPK